MWYEPTANAFAVWQWLDVGVFDFFESPDGDTEKLGLKPNQEYVPVLGDFDGDLRTDIFWYGPGSAEDVVWWSIGNQGAVIFSAATTQLEGEYRPFVGDFDASGTTDILWFAAYRELAKATSRIWYFDEDRTFVSRELSTNRDYSPYVADFDDDGCSDILWYRPEAPDLESPIWRCVPEALDFDCEEPVSPPAGAYPIGYGGAY